MVLTLDATWANAPIKDPADPSYVADLNPSYDAADLRRADAAMFAGTGLGPFGVRGGIVLHASNSLAVTVDGADAVTIQAGAVVIPGDAIGGTGCYRCANPAAYGENLTPRDATNPRIDLVVFRMLDVDVVGSHTKRRAQIEIIPGTPAPSPSVPVKPSMAVELARITVPASGGGAAIVDPTWRTFATALGGELLVTALGRLPGTAPKWQRARTLDTGTRYTFNGTSWNADDVIPLIQRGVVTTANHVVNSVLATSVNFPTPYPAGSTPVVTATVAVSSNPSLYNVAVDAVTANGFTLKTVRNSGTATLIIGWIAVG